MRWLLTGCALMWSLVCASQLAPGLDDPPSTVGRGFYAGFGLVAVWITVHVTRSGVFADEHGVTLRNYLRVHHIPWHRIEAFRPPKAYGVARDAGLRVCLRGGGHVCSSLYAAGPFTQPGFADDVVAALEHWRTARRHMPPGAPDG